MTKAVVVAFRDPFSNAKPKVYEIDPSKSLGEIVDALDFLKPYAFRQNGTISIVSPDGKKSHQILRNKWDRVKIKPGQSIALQCQLHGDDGKGILGIIFAIAVLLTGGLVAAAGIPALGIAGGTVAAKLIGAGIALAGSLLASAITPPPVNKPKDGGDDSVQRGPASINGNLLSPAAPIPRVIGTRERVFPPFACQPFTYFDGLDEYTEAVFVLAGPHKFDEIRIDDGRIEDAADIEYEVREGFADDLPIELIQRYAITRVPRKKLKAFDIDPEDTDDKILLNQLRPNLSIPEWFQTSTLACDEFRMDILFPQGLFNADSPGEIQGVPFRLRFRETADDVWVNAPEIHFWGNELKTLRGTIIIRWDDDPLPRKNPHTNRGWCVAAESTTYWDADSMFASGAGPSSSLHFGNAGASTVRRVHMDGDDCYIYLDTNTIAKGAMQVEIKRGLCYAQAALNPDNMLYGGQDLDPFNWHFETISGEDYYTVWRPLTKLSQEAQLIRQSSVTNTHPIKSGQKGSRLAIISLKAKNRQIGSLSCKCGGYVNNWDGSDWDTVETTSNPAAHFRDILIGRLSADPLPLSIVDESGLEDWHDACDTAGYTCDLVVEGATAAEVLTIVASCGYGRPYASEKWGVIRDYDRSAEDPTQIFTPRNSNGISLAIAFPRLPDALRVRYRDSTNQDIETEITVWNPDTPGGVANPRFEEVTYRGLVALADITARAEFDLKQARLRSQFISFQAPAEAIVCRRGDLIGLNHDVLDKAHYSARIADVEYNSAGNVSAIWIDEKVEIWNEDDFTQVDDLTDIDDVTNIGRQTAVAIRRGDGTVVTHTLSGTTNDDTTKLVFATPFANGNDADGDKLVRRGNLIAVGRKGEVFERLIVAGIESAGDLVFNITAVPEAPELFA